MEAPPGFFRKRGGGPASEEDRPDGFGMAATPPLSSSVTALYRRSEWWYIDPNGQEHGPVSFNKISTWYNKGHFPDDVKVGALQQNGYHLWGQRDKQPVGLLVDCSDMLTLAQHLLGAYLLVALHEQC
jgi:hypothetical protein